MKHMCIILAEHASTSHVTYTLHHTTPNGQYPENSKRDEKLGCQVGAKRGRVTCYVPRLSIIQAKIEKLTSKLSYVFLDKEDYITY